MKKAISIVLLFSFVLTMLCACGADSSPKTETTEQVPPTIQSENTVSQEHIDFILTREVFMPGMESYYKQTATYYDKYFDADMTFSYLINSTYFESLKWEYLSNEEDMIIVTFYGIANGIADKIPISASFAWTSSAKAPIINAFIFGKNADGSYNEHSANTIQEAYGYDDYSMALFTCDATFSILLASALIDVAENDNQEQTTPSTSVTPSTPSNSGQQSSGEQTTTPNNPTTEQTTPPLTAADYYQMGKDSHSAKQYLEAVEHFKKADGYSDSSTMILDCYYEYGKAQMDLQYTSEGTKYLSMCRGYKDTDEILLSFYYSQATTAYNTLIQDFSTYGDHSAAYQDAKQKLLLCEGYKDSTTMMRVVESIYAACKDMDSVSGWEASLSGMSVTANGNNVAITKEKFMGGGGGDLVLNTDVLQKTFTATISRIFAPNMRNYGEAVVIEALLLLFTDISSTSDLSASLQSETAWTINGTTETFSTSYGGYSISIQVTEADWGYIDCAITVCR